MKFYYEHSPERKWAYRFVCISQYYKVEKEILQWLKESFGPIKGRFRYDPHQIDLAFKEEGDALMFRMKWVDTITDQKPWDLK